MRPWWCISWNGVVVVLVMTVVVESALTVLGRVVVIRDRTVVEFLMVMHIASTISSNHVVLQSVYSCVVFAWVAGGHSGKSYGG